MLTATRVVGFAVALSLLPATTRAADPPPVSQLSFRNAAGKTVAWKDISGKTATVVVFFSFDCPMCTGYAKPLADLAAAHAVDGVAFVGVAPTDDTPAALAKHATDYKLGFPVFHDARLAAADALKATTTPEVVVLDAAGAVRYRGRIDDAYTKRLVQNRKPSESNLKDALAAVVAGRPVTVAKTEPVGCRIVRDKKVATVGGPTFHKDVLPILMTHCQECHRPNAVGPFPLLTYKHAVNWADDIKDYTADRRMPPWKPRGGHALVGERKLSEMEIATLAKWADAGCPEGSVTDAPTPRLFPDGWSLGEPDLILSPSDDFVLGPTGKDVFRVFVLPTGLTEDKYVTAFEVRPGNPRVVHHAVNVYDTTGSARLQQELKQAEEKKRRKPDDVDVGPGFTTGMLLGLRANPAQFLASKPPFGPLGGWAPGVVPRELPDGTGFLLPKGSDFVIQMHYHRNGRVERDRTRIGLYFAKKPVTKAVLPLVVPGRFKTEGRDERASGLGYIPAGDPHFVSRGTWYALEDCTLHMVLPHMHLRGKSVKITLTPPGGTAETLIDIPDWDYNWQENYVFKVPVRVRAGTRFDIEAVFDNSASNPSNPNDPPTDVRFGEQTTDEMLIGAFAATKDNPRSGVSFAITQGPFRLTRPAPKRSP